MRTLGQAPQHQPVALVPRPVAHLPRTWLQDGLQVVQHEEPAPRAQQVQQQSQPGIEPHGDDGLPRGENADGPGKPLLHGQRVAQAAPIHHREQGCQLVGELGCQRGLADATHTQHFYHAAVLIADPALQQGQILGAPLDHGQGRPVAPIMPGRGDDGG